MPRRSYNNNSNNRLLYDPNQREQRRLGAFSMEENEEELTNEEENEEIKEDINEEENINNSEETYSNNTLVKSGLKEGAKQAGKQIGKTVTKVAGQVSAKLLAFIMANPWVLAIIAVVVLLIIIILAFTGTSNSGNGYYLEECNFNSTKVNLKICDSEETSNITIKDYVMKTTKAIVADNEVTDNSIKAIMIIVKTNALSTGNYNNSTKLLNLDTCEYGYSELGDYQEKYEELYKEIENYLYISKSYNDIITTLSSGNNLVFDENIKNQVLTMDEDKSYSEILNSLYNQSDSDTDQVTYTNNLYIGDSRFNQMKNYGIIDGSKTIYGGGYGYDWFIGNGEYSASYTNALNGAIEETNKRINENTKYNIFIWLGINDLAYRSAEDYFNKYLELATNEWSKHNLYIIEVGPVDENKTSLTNTQVNEFNNILLTKINSSGISNLKFINIDYNIEQYDAEGLHYGSSDYSKIYSNIMSNVSNTGNVSSNYKLYNLDDYCEYIYINEDGSNTSDACESMSISSTSLSREEFISKLQSYYTGKNKPYHQTFSTNAGEIYDISIKNNINPELVVVRAHLEGYSPVSQGYSQYNNYWGLRCYNGQSLSSCASYSSFEDGVLGFVNNVSQYDSLGAMMQRYAYIGDYWFNPGNAGSGGCYYFDYIKKYLSSSRATTVANACAKGNSCSGSNCLKTTEEDQAAYAKWQVEKMTEQRNSIFNITTDYCEGYSSNCTIFAQGDKRWGSISLGSSSTDMANSGCAVTSIAIGIACSGTETSVANFDAGKFIKALNEGGCFTSSGEIYWGCSAINKIAPNVHLVNIIRDIGGKTISEKTSLINNNNQNGNFVLVHFVNNKHSRGHYVVVNEVSGNKVIAKDPAGGKISSVDLKYIDQIVVYRTR